MPLNKLYRSFEERRNALTEKLERNKDEFDLSQQHQIYGAIKEIENFLRSIDHHRTLEAENNFDIELSKEREWPIIQRTQRIIKAMGKGMWQIVAFTLVKGPIKVGKGIVGQFEAYHERREIYKKVKKQVDAEYKERLQEKE